MTKQYGEKQADGHWRIPAAERNKEPILEVLREWLPGSGLVLEIASGTGQHVVHFAGELPALRWQPTDPDKDFRESITSRIRGKALENIRPPVDLNVLERPWPITRADAIICINMIHVAPWRATGAMIEGCGDTLEDGGVLFLYGPYRRFGVHTAASNEAFDSRLHAQNSEWGVRNLEDVQELAARADLSLERIVEMPANNLGLIFRQHQ